MRTLRRVAVVMFGACLLVTFPLMVVANAVANGDPLMPSMVGAAVFYWIVLLLAGLATKIWAWLPDLLG